MNPRVISTKARFTNVFLLIQDGKGLLVDTGSRGQSGKIQKAITSAGLAITDLKYIFLTHTHYDHAGSAADLQALSGAKVIVHAREAGFLKNGFTPIPKGTSPGFKFISKMGKIKNSIERKVGSYPALIPDITFDHFLNLEELGFDAKIVHTPGHTEGSSSLIFADRAFVGDCLFNFAGTIYPGFADDELQLHKTWKQILEWEIKWFYPAHGKRVGMDQLKKAAGKKNIA